MAALLEGRGLVKPKRYFAVHRVSSCRRSCYCEEKRDYRDEIDRGLGMPGIYLAIARSIAPIRRAEARAGVLLSGLCDRRDVLPLQRAFPFGDAERTPIGRFRHDAFE